MAETPIRVVLIDDHRTIHEMVSEVLGAVDDIKLVAQAGDGNDVLRLCQDYAPHVVLMDVVMPGIDGVEATRLIHEQYPDVRVLVLSSFQDDDSVHAMLESGASGYVTKHDIAGSLVTTIRSTFQGHAVFSDSVADQILTPDYTNSARQFGLSARELEVLALMAQGLTNDQIARDLVISRSTVNFHIGNIIRKLGVETRSEALVVAAKKRLV